CFHSIHNAERITLNERIAVLSAEDRTYAQYLATTFELLWKQSTPAEERIRELFRARAAKC
ncbi:MAG: hypothetical protein ACXV5F_08585, partial [Halobacteriota archaeon]